VALVVDFTYNCVSVRAGRGDGVAGPVMDWVGMEPVCWGRHAAMLA
jgi:hypothetical protein